MKMKIVFLSVISLLIILNSCTETPVYNNYYNSNFITQFYTLTPGNWKQVPDNSIQWFQEFPLPTGAFRDFDQAGVMCYYLNQFDSWEALPSTRIFWTDNDVVYSDELWFSNNKDFLYIDYRNTIPGVAAPPKDNLLIKAVYFDADFRASIVYKDINWLDYDDVSNKLNLKD